MTQRLYQHDAYLKAFEASVLTVLPEGVVLDRTAFFPTGGGVQCDHGTLQVAGGGIAQVVETVEHEQGILHRFEASPGPEWQVGAHVQGRLDWERRYALMRYHTATHVLSGVMFHEHDVRVTGNQLTPDKGRVDFSFAAYDPALLEDGFARSNALVGQNLPVEVSFISAEEANQRPELFKLEVAFKHAALEELRLVDIKGFDVQADGGCHVASLAEIGTLRMAKAENKGKSNRRVYFVLEAPQAD